MADITVTFTDDDQAFMAAQAAKTKAKFDNLNAHNPPRGIDILPVCLASNTNAVWMEDKLGLPRGTLQGSGSFSNYNSDSGGTPKSS